MRYAIRNIVRLKGRSFLTFAIAFSVLFLSMVASLVIALCEDNRSHFYGPLDGSCHVTDDEFLPYLSYEAAVFIDEDASAIRKISAKKEYVGYLHGVDYIGKGEFTRSRYTGEPTPAGKPVDYILGFQIVGVTSMEMLEEVYREELTLSEGTMITDDDNTKHHNKIVISKELAEQNSLSLGDELTLDMRSIFETEKEAIRLREGTIGEYNITYIVGGIYQNENDNFAGVTKPWLLHANHVYVPISTLSDIAESDTITELYDSADMYALKEDPAVIPDSLYFHLADMKLSEKLEKELNELGFGKRILLSEYISDASSSPSARISEIMTIILTSIIAVGLAIFLLSVLFNMKTRHRELAVLAALGKRRYDITLSFFTELGILTLFALVVGGGVSAILVVMLASPLTNYLYAAEYSAQFHNETLDSVLGETVPSDIIETISDTRSLLTEYFLPSFVFAVIAGIFLLMVLFLFVDGYVKRINALSGVGGKE